MTRIPKAAAALLLAAALAGGAQAQSPASAAASAPAAAAASAPASGFHIRPVDDAWRRNLPRDADAATRAWLARLSPEAVARSNAYFEGGYWLLLWNFLVGLGASWLLLGRRRAARVRDWAQRTGRKPFLRDALFGAFWGLAANVISFPLDVYQGLIREQQYGMATQTFGPWFAEHLMQVGITAVTCAIAVPVLYALFRRAGERWWMWGSAFGIGLIMIALLVVPVWVEPLFNTYKPVSDPAIKAAVLQLAQADGVPIDNVWEFDASRQTTRVSANVTGIFGTAAVRLNDNLMKTSLPEIRAVMGHELGHFVMNHVWKGLCELALLLFAGFAFAKWAMDALLRRLGPAWGLRGADDVASFPLLMAVISTFFLLATPIQNTLVRTQEIEADRFGLNLAREPIGAAEAFLKLTEYRKPDPTPLEEFVFYDHPSTRFRIHDAMRWRQAMGTP
jgi:STE24 endopeptidase